MRRGGEGRPPGRWGEPRPRNTAVPANVLQQSYRAPGLQMHRWGCWLVAPLLGSRSSTWRPHPLLSEGPEAWPRLARPPASPLSPPPSLGDARPGGLCSGPHQIVLKAGSKGEWRAAQTPTGLALEPLSRHPEQSTRDCPAVGGSWLPPMLTHPGPVSSPVIVCCAALAEAGASAAVAESAATAAPAATTAALVTYCTGSPSPGSGKLPHTPSQRTP